jgi:hypothetical protein
MSTFGYSLCSFNATPAAHEISVLLLALGRKYRYVYRPTGEVSEASVLLSFSTL